MIMCFWLHTNSQKSGQVLHIVQTNHVILRMIIVSIPLYVALMVGQSKFLLFTQMLSDAKMMLLHQISAAHVVSRAQGRQWLLELAYCNLPFLHDGRGRGGPILVRNILFFHLVSVFMDPVSSWDFPVFLFLTIACILIIYFVSYLDRFLRSFVFAHPAAKNSSDRFSYDVANAGYEFVRITTLPSLSGSVCSTCGCRGRKCLQIL